MRSNVTVIASLRAPKLDAEVTGTPSIAITRSPMRSCPLRIAGVSSPIAERVTTSPPSKPRPSPKPSYGSRSNVTRSFSTSDLGTCS